MIRGVAPDTWDLTPNTLLEALSHHATLYAKNDEDAMSSIPDILDDLRAGKTIVLTDDEDRENEGDLVCAAEHCTADTVNFMLREGRGMLFVALDGDTCDRLDLPPQAAVNTTQNGTAYTLTVDAAARFGLTTGVSAADRALTIRMLADPATHPGDLDRPGHVQPLRARDGGVLVRTGHTEGMVDLCRLAGLQTAAVGIEVMNDDGTMARRPQLEALCERHGLTRCSVADLVEYRMQRDLLVERIEQSPLTNAFGEWTLTAYRSRVDPMPHVALTCGGLGVAEPGGGVAESDTPTLVRMHRQNLLGDVFGDRGQDSRRTLDTAMRMIQSEGRGAVVYLRHEGMGRGLLGRLQTSTVPVAPGTGGVRLGGADDAGAAARGRATLDYGIGSQILRDLGLRRLRLITDHPFVPQALAGFGLAIDHFVTPLA